MIVVKLMGGLGNQLFQYAAGRSLSVKTGQELFLDLELLHSPATKAYTQRHIELDQLSLKYQIAETGIEKNFKPAGWFSFLKPKRKDYCFYPEEIAPFKNPEACKNIYLDGFWQSEDYFKEIRPLLLEEMRPVYTLSREFEEIRYDIEQINSVAIHVRRGDYVTIESTNQFHGLCGMDYYNKAMQYMNDRVHEPFYFVFSDDITWCRQNFPQNLNIRFVSLQNSPSSADLFLMSYCKHNIIANSSYSWWGAWLNSHEQKIVVAPSRWYKEEEMNSEDIYCKNWLRL